jgi:hypothetical protein
MLVEVATSPTATWLNCQQHVQLQHAETGCSFMLHFYVLLNVILVALPTKLKIFLALSRKLLQILSGVGDIGQKF